MAGYHNPPTQLNIFVHDGNPVRHFVNTDDFYFDEK
jgi:hypothetical protein